MTTKPSGAAPTSSPKRARTRKPNSYIAKLHGIEQPVIVLAMTQKEAFAALIKLRETEDKDLIEAGKNDYTIIDTINPDQSKITDIAKPVSLRHAGERE